MSFQATVSVAVAYEDPDAYPDFATDFPDLPVPTLRVALHPDVADISFDAASVGVAVLADGAAADDTVDIDFGDVDEALALYLKNNTAQDLGVSINGGDSVYTLSPGAVFALSQGASAATPINSVTLIATATQVGDQEIDFRLFGSAAS